MAWYKPKDWFREKGTVNEEQLNEALKPFKSKLKSKDMSGEGFENYSVQGFGNVGLSSFNLFHQNYIDDSSGTEEKERIQDYRKMAGMPEIADVVEDAAIESTQENTEGRVLELEIKDEELSKNEQTSKTIQQEFDELFYNRINMNEKIYGFFYSYFVDGRLYLENIINENKKKNGIVNIKQLPPETMDFDIDGNGKVAGYYQFIKPDAKRPDSPEEADGESVVGFYPSQITHVDSGHYGKSKKQVIGYLEKARQPYNQLKLLETAVVIYRIVRAPERFVFRIDTGNMPKDKAMRYVEKIKQKMNNKQIFDPNSGTVQNTNSIMSMLDNYWLSQCIRVNSEIPTLGGNNKTLKELIDDHNNGKKNEVYSVDQETGNIIKGEVEWAGYTRKNADLVRVWLDNGEYIDCTPDHKFVMRDGSEVEAQNLEKGQSVMPLYTRTKLLNKAGAMDYIQVFNPADNKWKWVHKHLGPDTKENEVVHHVDFNRYNNMKDNLMEMDRKEHAKYHRITGKKAMERRWSDPEERKRQSEAMKQRWLEQPENMKKGADYQRTEETIEKQKSSLKEKWNNDVEFRERMSKKSKERWNDPEFAQHMSDVQKCNIDSTCEYFLLQEVLRNNFPPFWKLRESVNNNYEFVNYWVEINRDKKNIKKDRIGKQSLYNIINWMGFNDYTELKNNVTINHKIEKVEVLPFKEDTGCLTIKDPGKNHNFAVSAGVFIKNSADGRGSQIDTIGGQGTQAFMEMNDIHYFQRKLYRALKYPMSRVSKMHEKDEGGNLVGGGQMGELVQDELKWAKFLERQQNKFGNAFLDLFLLHLEFRGLKKQYELSRTQLDIKFTPPNNYKTDLDAMILQSKFDLYMNLANNPEFSKSYLMKWLLDFSDEDLTEMKKHHDKDKELFPSDDMGF